MTTIENVPVEGWLYFAVIALLLLNVYNVYSTARKNAREEKEHREQPTLTLEEKIKAHDRMLDNDKRRLDEMERKQNDMERGQMANCRGVQALLEHELHNGNAEEMQEASHEIAEWLRKRP